MTGRDTEIRRAVEARAVQDVRILQKVNHAHREAFREKFPGQCEHLLRLIAERMQAGLTKTESTVLSDTSTWKMQPNEIDNLSNALHNIYWVYKEYNNVSTLQSLHTPSSGHE